MRNSIIKFLSPSLSLALALMTPMSGLASHYCVATNGGFGSSSDGTTFIGTNFSVPSEGTCVPWAGFTKSSATVVSMTYGNGCLSSDGTVLTLTLQSVDPDWFGTGSSGLDYIQFTRSSTKNSFKTGFDQGYWGGTADVVSCTSSLEKLPAHHD